MSSSKWNESPRMVNADDRGQVCMQCQTLQPNNNGRYHVELWTSDILHNARSSVPIIVNVSIEGPATVHAQIDLFALNSDLGWPERYRRWKSRTPWASITCIATRNIRQSSTEKSTRKSCNHRVIKVCIRERWKRIHRDETPMKLWWLKVIASLFEKVIWRREA